MRPVIPFILFFLLFIATAHAQRITQTYNDVPFSEALRQLSEQSTDYTISFLYDELEDFRITTAVSAKSIPDAIRQMIGFYPIRMEINGNDIVVECVQKTNSRYKGTILDEQGRAVGYANVMLLSTKDSTFIAGGVSNESGLFVIPCEQHPVIARISYVGYKTVYKICHTTDIGCITITREDMTLKGVRVKGERIISNTENGHLTYNMPLLLQAYPADNAYEALTRIPGVIENDESLMFSGRPVTLIINGKATTLNADKVAARLKNMPAEMLAKAEIMPSAPPKYHVRGMAINIITKDFTGTNQISGQLLTMWKQHTYGTGKVGGNVLYNRDKLSLDAYYTFTDGINRGRAEHEANHPLGEERKWYFGKTYNKSRGIEHEFHIGADYAFSEDSRLSLTYTGDITPTNATNTTTGSKNSVQHFHTHEDIHNIDASYTTPFGLQLTGSYIHYRNPKTQNLEGDKYDNISNLSVCGNQKINKWLFAADQMHTLNKYLELMYGVKVQYVKNNSYQTTFDQDNNELADGSSRADYSECILNAYSGIGWHPSKALSLDASLTAEQYHATKWNNWHIYPQLNAMWNANEKNMLNLSFSSEAVYPSYWSTMSSVFYSTAYNEIWGNPDLKPWSSYNIDLTWQLNHKYTFVAFALLQSDYAVQLPYQPSDRMAVIMKETNFDYSNTFGLQVSALLTAGRWLNATINATGIFKHDKSSNFFDLPFDRTHLNALLSTNAAVRLSQRHNWQLVLNSYFQSKAIQGVYDLDPMLRINVSLRWTSDNKKWNFIMQGNNLLGTGFSTRSTWGNQDFTMRGLQTYPHMVLIVKRNFGDFKEKKRKAVDTSRMGY